MRKVLMLVTLSSDRFHFLPGQEAEFKEEEAKRLVENHYAKFMDDEIIENPNSKKEKKQ